MLPAMLRERATVDLRGLTLIDQVTALSKLGGDNASAGAVVLINRLNEKLWCSVMALPRVRKPS